MDNTLSILFRCPRCLCHLRAVDLQAGWQLPCPKCHAHVEVPRPVEPVEPLALAYRRHDEHRLMEMSTTAMVLRTDDLITHRDWCERAAVWLEQASTALSKINPLTFIWISLGMSLGLLVFLTILCW